MILFDEVEKAHPDVFNILLQVLDDGRITDSQGRTVDFRNTVIVMTSNIGGEYILDVAGDESRYEEMVKRVMGSLRSHFRPEFLNRVDDIILFHQLSKGTIYVDHVDDKLVFNHQPLIPKLKEEPLIMNVQPMRKTISDPLEMDVQPVILTTSKTPEGDDIITVEPVKDN